MPYKHQKNNGLALNLGIHYRHIKFWQAMMKSVFQVFLVQYSLSCSNTAVHCPASQWQCSSVVAVLEQLYWRFLGANGDIILSWVRHFLTSALRPKHISAKCHIYCVEFIMVLRNIIKTSPYFDFFLLRHFLTPLGPNIIYFRQVLHLLRRIYYCIAEH